MAEDGEEPVEPDDAELWRLERFLELGVPFEDAELLAAAGADWHRFAALIEAGCPLGLAVRILA